MKTALIQIRQIWKKWLLLMLLTWINTKIFNTLGSFCDMYKIQHFQFYPDIRVKHSGVEPNFWERWDPSHPFQVLDGHPTEIPPNLSLFVNFYMNEDKKYRQELWIANQVSLFTNCQSWSWKEEDFQKQRNDKHVQLYMLWIILIFFPSYSKKFMPSWLFVKRFARVG